MFIETKIILTGLISAIAVLFIMPRWIKVLVEKKRFDIPTARSAHTVPIPSMGGITFLVGLMICATLFWNSELTLVCLLIGAAGLLGLWDDFKDISPRLKLLGQLVIAAGFYTLGFSINPMISMFFDFTLMPWMDLIGTMIFVAGVMNSFNLLDGVDGLLAGVGIVCSVTFSVVFFLQGNMAFLGLSVAITGVLVAFLFFNYHPASIFMGDTGSLLIGAYIAASILAITKVQSVQSSSVVLACMIVSALDMTRLFVGRYLITKRPFQADKNHMHHVLLRLKWNPKKIMWYIVSLQSLLIVIAFTLGTEMGLLNNALVLLCIGVVYMGLLQMFLFRSERQRYLRSMERTNNEAVNNELLKTYLYENEVHFYN